MNPLHSFYPQKIFLTTDGSPNSQAAAELVFDLPLAHGSQVILLSVLDTPHSPRRANLMAALENTLAMLEGPLEARGIDVSSGILHGHPAQALVDFAAEHEPDLIVMGATGLRATFGILLGGVTQQLIEYSRWPVLVVRMPYQGLRRILLLTDGSSYSQAATAYLGKGIPIGPEHRAQLPLPSQAELQVLHVMPPFPTYLTGEEVPSAESEEASAREILTEAVDRLASAGLPATPVLLRGDAATEIVAYAEENVIDLLVTGSRGLNPVRGWLLGSLSRKLVHYSGTSVLIVRAPSEVEGRS